MKKTPIITSKPALLVAAGLAAIASGAAALWWIYDGSVFKTLAPATPKFAVVTTAEDSRGVLASYLRSGGIRGSVIEAELSEALSPVSRLAYARRLQAVHARYGTTLTGEQSEFLRSFVADPTVPAGLTMPQIRALKNDVLNLLCAQIGEEALTAAVLRALYADQKQDPGLRDYALQHLVDLIEREPAVGWQTHWAALEGSDENLAATALLHLVSRHRSGDLFAEERLRLESAALRIAGDVLFQDPPRTTAIQICGGLKLVAARNMVFSLARSDGTGIPLRIAAIAALAELDSGDEVKAFFSELRVGSEVRLRVPAESALRRIRGSSPLHEAISLPHSSVSLDEKS